VHLERRHDGHPRSHEVLGYSVQCSQVGAAGTTPSYLGIHRPLESPVSDGESLHGKAGRTQDSPRAQTHSYDRHRLETVSSGQDGHKRQGSSLRPFGGLPRNPERRKARTTEIDGSGGPDAAKATKLYHASRLETPFFSAVPTGPTDRESAAVPR